MAEPLLANSDIRARAGNHFGFAGEPLNQSFKCFACSDKIVAIEQANGLFKSFNGAGRRRSFEENRLLYLFNALLGRTVFLANGRNSLQFHAFDSLGHLTDLSSVGL